MEETIYIPPSSRLCLPKMFFFKIYNNPFITDAKKFKSKCKLH